MNLLQQFQQHYKHNLSHLFAANTKFLLAVSGGIDSVVLVDLFFKTNLNFAIAHCNFNLRHQESYRDEDFVRGLATTYKKPYFVQRFETEQYATENKLSIQVAARELRYQWFAQLMNEKSEQPTTHEKAFNALVTAHHSNDNIETVLFNFFRGTGIQGLTGIKTYDTERNILRPLLPFKKQDIVQYAQQQNILYVEDSSNTSNKYTRNYFRNLVIPQVVQHFPNTEENILATINRMNDVEALYNQAIATHKKNLCEKRGNDIYIPILKLQKATPLHTIIYELIKPYNFTAQQINEVEKLLISHNGSYIQSATHRIINNRNWLIISSIQQQMANTIIVEPTTKFAALEQGKLLFEYDIYTHTLAIPNKEKQTVKGEVVKEYKEMLNADKLEYPLLLRKWKQGDYFYPLGMQKKQKLSKFFINQKLSITDKENIWVLESNKKIVYIVGYRIDDRYKLTPATKNVLHLTYLK